MRPLWPRASGLKSVDAATSRIPMFTHQVKVGGPKSTSEVTSNVTVVIGGGHLSYSYPNKKVAIQQVNPNTKGVAPNLPVAVLLGRGRTLGQRRMLVRV